MGAAAEYLNFRQVKMRCLAATEIPPEGLLMGIGGSLDDCHGNGDRGVTPKSFFIVSSIEVYQPLVHIILICYSAALKGGGYFTIYCTKGDLNVIAAESVAAIS